MNIPLVGARVYDVNADSAQASPDLNSLSGRQQLKLAPDYVALELSGNPSANLEELAVPIQRSFSNHLSVDRNLFARREPRVGRCVVIERDSIVITRENDSTDGRASTQSLAQQVPRSLERVSL